MNLSKLFAIWLMTCAFFATNTFGQAEAASINNYNSRVNDDIAAGRLYVHRITLNSSDAAGKVWGSFSKYQETANCYFEMQENGPVLKKVIVFSEIAGRQSYSDYLYDAQGNPTLCMFHRNVTSTTELPHRCHYMGRKLLFIAHGDVSRSEADLTTEDQQEGLDLLEKASNYKKVFEALAKVQMPPR